MRPFESFYRIFLRFRYPVSLPQHVGEALGLSLDQFITFDDFFHFLISPTCQPTRLTKFMPREQAEKAFDSALRKERFKNSSLFSYCFTQGWMEFVLFFDDQSRLRRIYILHKQIPSESGVELRLQ